MIPFSNKTRLRECNFLRLIIIILFLHLSCLPALKASVMATETHSTATGERDTREDADKLQTNKPRQPGVEEKLSLL